MPSESQSTYQYPTRILHRPLPQNAEKIILSKMDITNQAVEYLKSYCRNYKAKTYSDVRYACKYALSNLISVKDERRVVLAKDYKGFTDKFTYFVDKTAAELDIYPQVINPYTFKRLELKKKPNPVEFLYYTYLLMPNLDPNYFAKNMNNIRTAVNTFWNRLSGIKHSSDQSMLFLYSTEGGVGKSVLQNILFEWAKKYSVKATYTRAPHNQFVGDEFNKNALCLFSDITKEECQNWARLNDLIDGTNYVVEKKGENRYELKSQAFLVGSSNFHPKDENNRRIANSIVVFSSMKLEPITDHTAFVLKDNSVDISYYIPIVNKWIESCPDNRFDYRKYPTEIVSSAGDWFDDIDDDYAFVLRAIANYCLADKDSIVKEQYKISVATMWNRLNKYVKNDLIKDTGTDYVFSRKQINHILSNLYKRNKIVVAGNAKGTYQKSYWIKPLFDNAAVIAKEHTNNNYNEFFDLDYDYIQQKNVVIDVCNKIMKSNDYQISDECLQFLKSETLAMDTKKRETEQDELPF